MPYSALNVRNSLIYELTSEYNKKLLVNDKKEIIETYNCLETKFPNISNDACSLVSKTLYKNAKESLSECKPLIEALKQRNLNTFEKIDLSNKLASAFIGMSLLPAAKFSD